MTTGLIPRLTAQWVALRAPALARKSLKQAAAALEQTDGPPTTKLGEFNQDSAAEHGWTLALVRRHAPITGWDDADGFAALQDCLGVTDDGWFGPKSYQALMRRFYGDKLIVAGFPHEPPAGVVVRNWYSSGAGVRRLPGKSRRGRTVNMVVAHESVTDSMGGTQSVLLGRNGLGVQLMVTPDTVDGVTMVTQHGDLLWDRMSHAGGQNGPSIGLEYVNRYYPEHTREGSPTDGPDIGPVGWAHSGKDGIKNYDMVPARMLEAGCCVLSWLCDPEGPVRIPRLWPGRDAKRKRFALSRVAGSKRKPGVVAHVYTAHADGGVPVLYSWLRMVCELDEEAAYEEAMRLASTTGRWAETDR